MQFSDMQYRRISYEEIDARYQSLFKKLKAASCEEACLAVMKAYYQLLDDMTPMDLSYVRHDMNVNDPFYAAEQNYYNEIGPKVSHLARQFNRLLTESPFHGYFEKVMGSFAFTLMKADLMLDDPRLIPLQQAESALSDQYSNITANAKVNYNGALVSRGSLAMEMQSADRETRRKATAASSASWEAQREQLEDIFDQLVRNRDQQAKVLGFPSYVELGYLAMNRIGYTPEDVRCFREQVKKFVVPLGAAVNERRKKRLGLEHMYSYDRSICFLNGNPVPLGGDEFCLEMTRNMFHKLSPETAEFIDFLLDHGLYDVEMRDGKRGGGYCAEFQAYKAPFIFANFDGTSENAYVMSHEGGHAFYAYQKRNEEIRERGSYTSEMAETHAMAMEFFVNPYMELFFGDRAEDYRQMHLEGAVNRILYQCQQDEFQHILYEQPQLTKQQRNEVWERLEQEYFPFREYTEEERQGLGCRWQRIPHIYHWPFYAIDYALAQVCALEYSQWMSQDFDGAWKSYLTFCRTSGNMNFPDTVKAAGLSSPFEAGSLKNLMDWLQTRLA